MYEPINQYAQQLRIPKIGASQQPVQSGFNLDDALGILDQLQQSEVGNYDATDDFGLMDQQPQASTVPKSLPVVNSNVKSPKGVPSWFIQNALKASQQLGVPTEWANSPALHQLVQHESGFKPTAQNPTSTAHGLFQFLNGTWKGTGIQKTEDPYLQTLAGLKYIKNRYKTPEKAWDFWQKNRWY